MKKRLLSFVLLLVMMLTITRSIALATPEPDNVINFPDKNFEAAVRNLVNKQTGVILQTDVADITNLYIDVQHIADLSGIEHFASLKLLDCSMNQLTHLDLSKNTELEYLQCSGNYLTELDLSNNTALVSVSCAGNQLTSIDVSKNNALRNLGVNGNYFHDTAAIIGLDESKLTIGFSFDRQRTFAPNIDTASDWARAEINNAYNKGFVPKAIQEDYTRIITRHEFCQMAVMFIEFVYEQSINNILSERGQSCNPNAFSDTTDPYILAAYTLGITNGIKAPTNTEPGIFMPDGQFSRQEAATMIMKICNILRTNTVSPPVSDFVDLSTADDWAREGINYVRAHRIMNGTNPSIPTFNPNGTFTCQESILAFDRMW